MKKYVIFSLVLFGATLVYRLINISLDPVPPHAVTPHQADQYVATLGVVHNDKFISKKSYYLSSKEDYWIKQSDGRLLPDVSKIKAFLEVPNVLIHEGSYQETNMVIGPKEPESASVDTEVKFERVQDMYVPHSLCYNIPSLIHVMCRTGGVQLSCGGHTSYTAVSICGTANNGIPPDMCLIATNTGNYYLYIC